MRRVGVEAAFTCERHAHVYEYVAGRCEAGYLPTVDRRIFGQLVVAQSSLPERRRNDVVHITAGDDGVAINLCVDGSFVDFVLTNTGGMYVCLVGQIHKVIYHEAIVAVDMIYTPAIRPI